MGYEKQHILAWLSFAVREFFSFTTPWGLGGGGHFRALVRLHWLVSVIFQSLHLLVISMHGNQGDRVRENIGSRHGPPHRSEKLRPIFLAMSRTKTGFIFHIEIHVFFTIISTNFFTITFTYVFHRFCTLCVGRYLFSE